MGSSRVINFMSEQNSNITNFTEAVDLLNNISKESFVADVWIPSMEKTVKIQEITAKQQKSLIESAIDSVISKSTFSKFFYEIVYLNCLEEKNVIESFTIIDKISIALSLRQQISDTLKIVFQENPKIETNVKISDVIEKFLTYKHPKSESILFSKNGVEIEVEMSIPLLSEEGNFDLYIYGNDKKEEDQIKEIKDLIASAFLGETAKFVKDIKINGNSINYNTLHIPQKIQFIEKLPASLIQNTLEKAVEWKSEVDKIISINHVQNGENYTKTIEVDSILFLSN